MNKNYLKFTKVLTLITMFGLTINYFAVKAGSFEVQGTENHCAGADVTSIDPDSVDLGTYTTDDGGFIDSVCVKSGTEHFVFTEGQTSDGCYSVAGIGTDSITVTRLEDSNECKEISHLDVVLADPEVSPSPEVSPAPEVSPSPEVSPTPEVSPSPEGPIPEVNPSPEITPTPTPNSCEEEQSCPSNCGAGATDVPDGSCGVKHCDPVQCSDDNDEEDRPIGGTSQGQVLGATTDSYAVAGIAEDIAFLLSRFNWYWVIQSWYTDEKK